MQAFIAFDNAWDERGNRLYSAEGAGAKALAHVSIDVKTGFLEVPFLGRFLRKPFTNGVTLVTVQKRPRIDGRLCCPDDCGTLRRGGLCCVLFPFREGSDEANLC